MDIAAFLRRHPPFDAVDEDLVRRAAATVRVEFFPSGAVILEQAGEPSAFLYLLRAGAVELLEEGALLDLLGPGEVFGHPSLLSGLAPTVTVRAHEDTICYLVEREIAEAALGTPNGLLFLGSTLRRRRASVLEGGHAEGVSPPSDPALVPVGSLAHRPTVTCPPDTGVAEAARLMAEQRVSSLLIPWRGGWGILTDRDLRTRVLAASRDPATPVAEVMTAPAQTVPAQTMAAEVLVRMFEGGFHHFPVTDGEGRPVGVVTDTDLMGLERRSPFVLKSAIERAAGVDDAVRAARELPLAVCGLVDVGADPVAVGHVIGVTIDALTRRLLELAIARRGEPPVPWAWLALGSAGRHEQALHTDQDHALAYDAEGRGDEPDAYFAGLAEDVTAGLEAAGIPRCAGGAMAANPSLRRSVGGWVAAFRGWMDDPGVEGSVLISIVFDYRRVAGPLEVERQLDAVTREAADRPRFLRHLSHRALDLRPPTGFLRNLVVQKRGEHVGTLDVKKGGIAIVANLARAWAIGAGIAEKGTLRRLAAAAATGVIDEEMLAGLDEAFRALWGVRLRHHCRQVRAGLAADDFVDPARLGSLERLELKESFRLVARGQYQMAAELGVPLR